MPWLGLCPGDGGTAKTYERFLRSGKTVRVVYAVRKIGAFEGAG